MGVTVATVTENVCLSRHRKADLEFFRSAIQTLATLTNLAAQKHDRTPAFQSVHPVSRTEAGLQIAVATKPYVEMSHMSNQKKSEFVSNIFCMRRFWGGHGEISTKTCFIQVGMICQEYYFIDRLSFRLP
jgi:hypothetical protein